MSENEPVLIPAPEDVLQDLVRCDGCGEILFCSGEGYLSCGCDSFPYRELSPEQLLAQIIAELKKNLEKPDFLEPFTVAANGAAEKEGMRFSDQEILRIAQKTIDNALMSRKPEMLRRTLTMFLDEITVHPDGRLEMYLIPTG